MSGNFTIIAKLINLIEYGMKDKAFEKCLSRCLDSLDKKILAKKKKRAKVKKEAESKKGNKA